MRTILTLFFLFMIPRINYSQTVYTFNGNGIWTNPLNWTNNLIPPTNLPSGSSIYISPISGGLCILNIPDTISQGASLIVSSGSNFVINGGMFINQNLVSYPSITICNQVWMTRNLDVDHYRNGDSIPQVSDITAWSNLTTGAWCYFNNDTAYGTTYGKLYNWYAVNDPRGLAPTGWHIPSDAEWTALTNCLGGEAIAGGAMKETGMTHWLSPNIGATNISGFAGLPGGYRSSIGSFSTLGLNGFWWSSTENASTSAWYRLLNYNNSYIFRSNINKTFGLSIRCAIGNPIPIVVPTITTTSVTNISNITASSGGVVTSDGGAQVTRRGLIYSTGAIADTTSTIGGGKIIDGLTGTGRFLSSLTSLVLGTTYHVRAFAVNAAGVSYGGDSTFTTLAMPIPYVTICNQVWMTRNLEVDHYRNGDPIPKVTDPIAWSNLTTGAWCYYNNDSANGSIYGKLYNWYAVNDPRGLAPNGWHIPTDAEWTQLTDSCLGGSSLAGSKMKTIGTVESATGLWLDPNTASNSSGFSGLPSGYRNNSGVFNSISSYGGWWSFTERVSTNAWYRSVYNNSSTVYSYYYSKTYGLSVRCVGD